MPKIKFDYKKFPSKPSSAFPNRNSFIRPSIPITFVNGNVSLPLYGIIDSGADRTILSLEYIKPLNVTIDMSREDKTVGIGGNPQKTYYHDLKMMVGGYTHNCTVGFVEGLSPAYVLLGQECFFHHFKKVSFNYNDGEIELIW